MHLASVLQSVVPRLQALSQPGMQGRPSVLSSQGGATLITSSPNEIGAGLVLVWQIQLPVHRVRQIPASYQIFQEDAIQCGKWLSKVPELLLSQAVTAQLQFTTATPSQRTIGLRQFMLAHNILANARQRLAQDELRPSTARASAKHDGRCQHLET